MARVVQLGVGIALTALLTCAAVACGLEVLGIASTDAPGDGGGGDATARDGTANDASDSGAAETGDPFGDASLDAPCAALLCDEAGACSGGAVCTPFVPLGWHVVEVGQDPAASCDPGYAPFGAPAIEYTAPAAGTCSCNCSVSSTGSCSGNVELTHGTGGSCNLDAGNYVADDGCRVLDNGGFLAPDPFRLGGIAAGAYPVCGSMTTMVMPTFDGGLLKVCRPPTLAASCENNHRVCAPAAATGYQLCIASNLDAGVAAPCPTGFTARNVTLATSVTDTRGCGACGCAGTPGSCSMGYTLFANSNCSGSSTGTSATGCVSTGTGGGSQQYTAGRFTVSGSAPGQTCNKISDPPRTGAVAPSAGFAVCCP